MPNFASVHDLFTLHERKFNRVNVGSWPINPDKVINDNPFLGIEVKNDASGVFILGGMNDMVANDDLLMITGNEAVIIFNGERWFNLFDKNRTEEELRATGTFYDPREL